jgi:transposase
MGTRKRRERQEPLWYRSEIAEAPGHPFYRRLSGILDEAGFDRFCEERCGRFYHQKLGRPSLAPGVYFRLMLIGFFEGLDSERGLAWRIADSLSLREFLGYGLDERTPDHATISRTRALIDGETHQAVFDWVLGEVARRGLLKGKTIGIDATTLEANAAMKSIVHRETGEGYQEFLRRLAQESGIQTPTRAELARLDRERPRKGSNQEWVNPHDPEAEITKMKDGRTHLAYKAEQAVDLDTGAIVAVTTHGGATADSESIRETLPAAGEAVAEQIPTATPEGEYKVQAHGVERWSPTKAIAAARYWRTWLKWACAATSRSRSSGGGNGRANRTSRPRCTRTGGACGASAAKRYCAVGARNWNVRSPTSTRPEGCAECTCEGEKMFSSASCYRPPPAIWR